MILENVMYVDDDCRPTTGIIHQAWWTECSTCDVNDVCSMAEGGCYNLICGTVSRVKCDIGTNVNLMDTTKESVTCKRCLRIMNQAQIPTCDS